MLCITYYLTLGQTINITVYDFGLLSSRSNPVHTALYCDKYLIIREPTTEHETIVCGGDHRINTIYTSQTNVVDLILTSTDASHARKYFLIESTGMLPDPTLYNIYAA